MVIVVVMIVIGDGDGDGDGEFTREIEKQYYKFGLK